ncbi:MAG: sugar phosphate isomerase/epimerase [Oscillospiraceae bacterium]|nr:sugar phosphate isomerase/epimerase [Oscillospiraceae bacterium]
MKIGIIDSAYKLPDGSPDYEKIKRHGYDCLDGGAVFSMKSPYYFMPEDQLKRELTEVRKKVLDLGLEFSQVHGPWPVDDSTAESRREKVTYIKTAIRAASYLDGKYLVVHPTILMDAEGKELSGAWEENEALYRDICGYAEGFGIGICIENMPYRDYSLSSVRQISDFVRTAGIPNLSICYDTGHAWLHGEAPADCVRMCGDLLKTLHVHDTDDVKDRHWLPFDGTIPWEGFGKALREIGFDGSFSMETCARDYTKYPPELLEYYEIGLAKIAKYLAEN